MKKELVGSAIVNKLNEEIAALRRSIVWTEQQLIIAKSNDDLDTIRFYESRIKRFESELKERLNEVGNY